MPDQSLTLYDINEAELLAVAQFLKRVGWQEIRNNAVDEEEAYQIRAGLSKLQEALADIGYNPH